MINNNKNLFISPILLLLFTFLTPLFLYGGVNDSIDTKKTQENLIYISAGATVHGMDFVSNATVIKAAEIQSNSDHDHKLAAKRRNSTIEKQIVSRKIIQEKSLKKLQDKINQKIECYYYPVSQDDQLLRLEKFKMGVSANVINSHHLIVSNIYLLNVFQIHLAKQKFDTSLSFLQFNKLLNSFLRGPPATAFYRCISFS